MRTARDAAVSAAVLGATWLMSVNRNPRGDPLIAGVPAGVAIFLAIVLLLDVITRRTRFGRCDLCGGRRRRGGSARRHPGGPDPDRGVRAGLWAGRGGGILAASRLYAVNQSSGGGDILLNAIAAAVIGGTSLFGGRGSAWSALLGALVIGAITNGMDLLAFASSVRFVITGAVLLVAVTVDAAARLRRERFGR